MKSFFHFTDLSQVNIHSSSWKNRRTLTPCAGFSITLSICICLQSVPSNRFLSAKKQLGRSMGIRSPCVLPHHRTSGSAYGGSVL